MVVTWTAAGTNSGLFAFGGTPSTQTLSGVTLGIGEIWFIFNADAGGGVGGPWTPSSVTIDGVAATLVDSHYYTNQVSQTIYRGNSTHATGNISVTFTGSAPFNCSGCWGLVSGHSAPTPPFIYVNCPNAADPQGPITGTVPANGLALVLESGEFALAAGTTVWSGATAVPAMDYSAAGGNNIGQAGATTTTASASVTTTGWSFRSPLLTMVIFPPAPAAATYVPALDLPLPNPNPYAYPGAWLSPGFDPSHPAAKRIAGIHGFSVVPKGAGFINLVTGAPTGIATGSLSGKTDWAGPAVNTALGAASGPQAAVTDNEQIMACIFSTTTTFGGGVPILSNGGWGSSGTGGILYVDGSAGLQYNSNGGSISFTGTRFLNSTGSTFFVAASVSTTKPCVAVVVDLAYGLGALHSDSQASIAAFNASSGGFVVGGDSWGNTFQTLMHAAMYAPGYMTRDQLVAWAKDPWSFWYPKPAFDLLNIPEALAPPLAPTVGGYDLPLPSPTPLVPPSSYFAPGFDPLHPASRGIKPFSGYSAVFSNGTFIDVLTKRKFTPTSVTPALTGPLGLAAYQASGTINETLAGNAAPGGFATAGITFACMVRVDGSWPGAGGAILTGRITDDNPSLKLGASGQVTFATNTGFTSSISVPLGVPCFVVASHDNATIANCLIVNLLTGQVSTSVVTGVNGPPAGADGTYQIFAGEWNAHPISISAAMVSNVYLTIPQLREWAKDPWSFWYPRPAFDPLSVFGAAGAAAAPVVTGGSTLPFMGVG